MLVIRLPQSIEKRLEKLARRTGRTKTYYVGEAILEHLLDASQAKRILNFLHQRVAKLDDQTIRAASERRCTARGLESSGNTV